MFLVVSITSRASSIISETLVFILILIKTWGVHKLAAKGNTKAPLVNLLLRDGALYFG